MKRKRSNTLVALSSAAVMSVYAAGFMRTRAAAERLEHASRQRVPVMPAPAATAAAATMPVETAPAAPSTVKPLEPSAPESASPIRKKVARLKAEPQSQVKAEPAAPASAAVEPATPPVTAAIPAAPGASLQAPQAPQPVQSPQEPMSPSAEVLLGGTELRDGTFLGWGTSRHGDIQASVTIYSGRITAVSIAQCRTRYSCDVIAHLPAKVFKDQTPEKINNVSGATQSVDAFYYAVVDAMNKAKVK